MLPNSLPEESRDGARLDDTTFTRCLAELRPALRGYIFSILPHPDYVEDVVQETFIFLWEHRETFEAGTNFKAWAFRTGYFKALSHRREIQRSQIVTLSEDVLHRIAGAAEAHTDHADARMAAMGRCLREIRPKDLRLLQLNYVERKSLSEQARALNAPPNRLQKAISRIRIALRWSAPVL